MALQLGQAFSPKDGRVPAGFERAENEIWQDYLDAFGDSYEFIHYNVRIGEDRISEEDRKDPYKKMVEDIALKRIDAVGFRSGVWDIIEVRRHAGPGTMGQLLAYENLWLTYAADKRPYTLWIVTDYMDVDTQLAARARGISIAIV